MHVTDLHRELSTEPLGEEEAERVDAVTEQLATQGTISRSRVSTGEAVLILQVQEIERYSGALIMAARNNPRGVPALELQAIAQLDFILPGILENDRLRRDQERPVLECTVQLLLDHGICFRHEDLLVFPTLFSPALVPPDSIRRHTVSLYYDFAGAVDNIYASLIAWLVVARNFGRVRLWPDRAEFEAGDQILCGISKVGRPGGFAHVDVFFETDTPQHQRELFISFVEEHLRLHGMEIVEHIAMACSCGHQIDEEAIRKRIARGDRDVVCSVCETRHNLAEGAAESRQRDSKLSQRTWVLKIEKRRHKSTEEAVRVLESTPEVSPTSGPLRLLHLSDLHFTGATPVRERLQWLSDDIKHGAGLGFEQLDYVVITGDFTDRGCSEGFEKAYEFVAGLIESFGLSAERFVFVPGNHDVKDLPDAFEERENKDGHKVIVRTSKYPYRLQGFSDQFFHKLLQRPYPMSYPEQGVAIPFWEKGIQFLTLNSCWQIDQYNRKQAGVHSEAVANVIREAQKQEQDARRTGQFAGNKPILRIAAWHHSVTGPSSIADVEFLGHLQNNGVRIVLHGDVHEERRDLVRYWHPRKKYVIGAGSFGASAEERPESTPRLYNLLEIKRDLKSVRVHTRCQPRKDGPWKGWNEWEHPDGRVGGMPYYDISWDA